MKAIKKSWRKIEEKYWRKTNKEKVDKEKTAGR